MPYPQYILPSAITLGFARDLLLHRRRSFQHDSRQFAKGISSLRVVGAAPPLDSASRGWLVTVNHYSRSGFRAWWIAVATSSIIPAEMHWVITSAWTYPDPIRSRLVTPFTEQLLRRIAQVYGFTAMPPMPPRRRETARRAEAIRRVLRYVRTTERPVVGLAPEGRDSPDGRLTAPPAGTGRFIAHLADTGLTILPVGVFEDTEAGAFCIRVGRSYDLPRDLPRDREARDAYVSAIVMRAIAERLPASMRNPCDASQSPSFSA